jgi:hypothetical protein
MTPFQDGILKQTQLLHLDFSGETLRQTAHPLNHSTATSNNETSDSTNPALSKLHACGDETQTLRAADPTLRAAER